MHCDHKIVEQGQFKYELAKLQKSTNNLLSCFGLIEENMDLSPIHLAVLEKKKSSKQSKKKYPKWLGRIPFVPSGSAAPVGPTTDRPVVSCRRQQFSHDFAQ